MTKSKRIDTVEVVLSSGTVTLPWQSRQDLLAHLRGYGSSAAVVSAFEAVGTSQPVTLSLEQKNELLSRIEAWERQLSSIHKLPESIWELRNALHDDVDEPAP